MLFEVTLQICENANCKNKGAGQSELNNFHTWEQYTPLILYSPKLVVNNKQTGSKHTNIF